MLTFICPHCDQQLRINVEHLGLRGKCNKCGGRIALVGRADAQRPQMASRLAEENDLDAVASPTTSASRNNAPTVLVTPREASAEHEPPTARQLDYLKRLGLPAAELQAVGSKAEASRLIEAWLPPPTQSQREYLHRLGATPAQIAVLRTKSDAADLIQRLLTDS